VVTFAVGEAVKATSPFNSHRTAAHMGSQLTSAGDRMADPLLQARGIVKNYGHVEALRGCDFEVYPNEIVALIGDNGAGKSTLIKILAGTEQADEGEILLEGHKVHPSSPFEAMRLGIETVYQDLALAPDLDGSANLYLGRELMMPGLLGKLGFLDNRAMRVGARKAFGELGVDLQNAQSAVANLSGGQRQSVAVARSVAWASKVVFLDEPTAALGVIQTARVLATVKRIRDRGVAAVLISHNMRQVLEVADRIEVLRLGRRVARFDRKGATIEQLVLAMTGGLAEEGAA
jgi:simple sugar transport system ATP-binding protein